MAISAFDVWEFVATLKGLGENYDKLRRTYHWLTDQQIRAALSFYSQYPDEIDEQID